MPRRVLLASLVCLMVVPAALSGRPAHADRISSLQAKIADARVREDRLQSDIGTIESRIRSLEAQVGGVSNRLDALEHDLALQQIKLNRIRRLYQFQTQQLDFFSHEYNVSVERLNARLIEMYESDQPSTLDVLMSATSLSDFLDQVDYVRDIGSQDASISTEVHGAKVRWHALREKTKVTKKKVETVTRTIAVRTSEVRAEKQRLLISEKGLASVRGRKKARLASVQESKAGFLHEVAGLQAASRQVTAQIQSSGSSSYDSSPSSSGLIWPVNGPVVSGFGMRWGRMHEGIDIAVPYGTPIHAAASGTVIFSGWMDGYGNFVIIDHGGGMATAYGHQSSIAAGGGQSVSQGQVIGYVGCTGHCFGPHLHFEVRINGTAVDPLGYL
ncbi:MAG TPA: peptidoglycan DD-metalloendopeptidase family protein [Gaiellaceae bacterium]|nr:peptidoglycan DD-metalloendopeptidase family protein [Gaiellaceae bacterium]